MAHPKLTSMISRFEMSDLGKKEIGEFDVCAKSFNENTPGKVSLEVGISHRWLKMSEGYDLGFGPQ